MGVLGDDTHGDASADFTPPVVSLDTELPYAPFSELQKAIIIAIVTAIALANPLALDMYYPSLLTIRDELGTTQSGITWTITAFFMTVAITPMVWSNLADQIGRKPVYLVAMAIYAAGSIGCALSQSLPVLVVSRIVQACGSSVGQGSGAGIITDIYPRDQRGMALGFYFLGVLIGPNIGPPVGGLIGEHAGWRWVFWTHAIIAGVLLLVVAVGLPETHRRIVAEKHPIQPINIPPRLGIRDNNPLLDICLLRYPVVAMAILNAGILYSTNIINVTSQPQVYESVYGLSQGVTGICMLGSGAGLVLGSLCGGRVTDLLIRRHRRKLTANVEDSEQATPVPVPPETRMRAMWVGGVPVLCGFVAWGWMVEHKVHLGATLAVQFVLGFGLLFTAQAVWAYLIDVFPGRSARAFSVQSFSRGMLGAAMAQALPAMKENIGWGWTYTVVFFFALLALLTSQVVTSKGGWLRNRYGPHITPE